jgi:paired small multidrug resistance pump
LGWTYVLFAAIIEVVWVLGLKYSYNFWTWTGTVIAIILSFYFIIKACEVLPSGSVYATFTGSGAAAIAIIDFSFLGETFTLAKGAFILLIIIGVVGIQLTTGEKDKDQNESLPIKEGDS